MDEVRKHNSMYPPFYFLLFRLNKAKIVFSVYFLNYPWNKNTSKIKVIQMSWKWNMFFCRIFKNIWHWEHTRGGHHLATRVQGAPPASWTPRGSPPLILAPTHFVFLQKKSSTSSNPSSSSSCCHFSISLLKAQFTKLLWGIVLRYVTPPMVQLVFVLMLYLLQIFGA